MVSQKIRQRCNGLASLSRLHKADASMQPRIGQVALTQRYEFVARFEGDLLSTFKDRGSLGPLLPVHLSAGQKDLSSQKRGRILCLALGALE